MNDRSYDLLTKQTTTHTNDPKMPIHRACHITGGVMALRHSEYQARHQQRHELVVM